MNKTCLTKLGIFAGGILFGTAGIKILSSKDAKKTYTNVVAAGLRAKDCVIKTTAKVQQNAEDVMAEAKEINRDKYGVCDSLEEECSCGCKETV